MTKLEICAIEDANPGVVYLYPEGTFYKAYQQSVGFPLSSFDKFSSGLRIEENPQGRRFAPPISAPSSPYSGGSILGE